MSLKMRGRVELNVFRDGELWVARKGNNLVTNTGKWLAASRFSYAAGSPPAATRYAAFGNGITVPHEDETVLVNEVVLTGGRVDRTTDTVAALGDEVVYTFDHTFVDILTITEVGLFNTDGTEAPDPLGDMAARFLTQEFSVTSGDILSLTWTLQFTGDE